MWKVPPLADSSINSGQPYISLNIPPLPYGSLSRLLISASELAIMYVQLEKLLPLYLANSSLFASLGLSSTPVEAHQEVTEAEFQWDVSVYKLVLLHCYTIHLSST